MKVSPEKIIVFSENNINKNNIFLISGNEETLIKGVEKSLISILKKRGFEVVNRESPKKINVHTGIASPRQLFNETEIKIFDNPQEIDEEYLSSQSFENTAIIIKHATLKNNSKTKLFFDKHEYFISITCYPLNKDKKKFYFDNFINKQSIKIASESYWFFIECSSNIFQIFENEMMKLVGFSEKPITVKEMRLLLSKNENQNFDKLFFLISGNKSNLFIESYNTINSVSDCYILMQRVKFFFEIIVSSNTHEEASTAFPKYLFENRATFILLYKKINKPKTSRALALIKKTEIMLRKNSTLYLPIIQRFLINLQRCFS